MLMVYNNFGFVVYLMNSKLHRTVKPEEEKGAHDWRELGGLPFDQAFFPRIIREFDDGPDEQPMLYGGQ